MRKQLAHLEKLPSSVYSRAGLWVVVPFVILTLVALFLLTRLTFRPSIVNLMPPNNAFAVAQRGFEAHFAEASYATLLFQSSPLFSPESLSRLAAFDRTLARYHDVKSVLSVASLKDMVVSHSDISFVSLYGGEFSKGDSAGLRARIRGTPLFRKFLLSKDGRSFLVYVFPTKNAHSDTLARELISASGRASVAGVRVLAYGEPIMRYYSKTAAPHDLLLLGAISLLVAFVLESLFARSLRIGAVLMVFSLVPAIWSLALFPLIGISVTIYTTVVPIMVIALSTSYGIHVMRYHYGAQSGRMTDTLDAVAPIVVMAGGTTMLAFASLLFTPVPLLRTLGLLVIPGIFFAIATSIFVLPSVLAAVPRPVSRAARGRGGAGGLSSGVADEHTGRPSRRTATAIMSAFGLALVFLAVGTARVHYDFRTEGMFRSGTPFGTMVRLYTKRNGGLERLEIAIDTGKEYGLVDRRVYQGIESLEAAASEQPDSNVISFTDFVNWVESRLSPGAGTPNKGPGARAIGEDLELLFSSNSGLRIDTLVDPSYRRARLIVEFGSETAPVAQALADFHALKSRVRLAAQRSLPPSVTVRFFGGAQQRVEEQIYLVESQVYSSAFFFAVLALLLLLAFRSLRWTVLVLLPPLSGMVFYFGVLGWLGLPFSPFTVFMVSAVMGVGNDDVLFLVLGLRRRLRSVSLYTAVDETLVRTGAAIVQTTVVLAAALCVLWFSEFSYVSSQGVLGGATLAACTTATYWVVPAILRSNEKNWKLGGRKE